MINVLDIVRTSVDRRWRITRAEMRDILAEFAAQGGSLENDGMMQTIEWAWDARGAGTRIGPSPDAPRVWANACTGITVVSVMPEHGGAPTYHGRVRYDAPGSLHPMHMADVMFAPQALEEYEYDQIGQLRRRARRVLVVSGDELPDPRAIAATAAEAAAKAEQVARVVLMLRAELADSLDPPWSSILDDGTLEMRDPNSGQGCDPADKPRFQWRWHLGQIERRHLPPESAGDRWLDGEEHEWAVYDRCPDGIIGDYIRAVCA
jgi:hypothetical protein